MTSLSYTEDGRFPVKTKNALGQTEFSAYDPRLGVVLQTTGPNGINACYSYDDVGRKTAQTERCGSTSPLTTTMEYHLVSTSDSPWAKLVSITRPPSGATTWSYGDGLARTVETLGRSFSGGFTETLTEYDSLGRTKRSSKPFFRA